MKATASEATLHFSGKAVTAWGALALMQRMYRLSRCRGFLVVATAGL